jgi:hypothetical protein
MREAMFDAGRPGVDLLNPDCGIYREIAGIAAAVRASEPLRFGRMYFRQISGDAQHFGFPYGNTYTLAFSRLLYGREALVAYNVSDATRSDCIVIDAGLHSRGDRMRCVYGGLPDCEVERAPDGTLYVRPELKPHQFVVLA